MTLVDWSKKLETGIKDIDFQHKELVKMLNELYEAYVEKNQQEVVEKVIEGLIDYTDYHFQTEEHLMRLYNYHRSNQHMIEHRNFQKKVLMMQKTIDPSDGTSMIKLINFMRDWLINHIQGSDQELSAALPDDLRDRV